jgi:hypothetical protein
MIIVSESQNIDEIVEALLEKTGYLDIFAVLSILNSAHLSKIARLIGKTKSTVLNSIDNMLEETHPLIEIDRDRTLNTRGTKKFYKLSDVGQQIDLFFEQTVSDSSVIENYSSNWQAFQNREVYRETIMNEAAMLLRTYGESKLRPYFSLGSELNYYFQRASTQSYLEMAKKVMDPKKREETGHIPYGIFFSSLKRIDVSSADQVYRIATLTDQFLKDLSKLEVDISSENTDRINEGTISDADLDQQIVFMNFTPIIED